MQMHAASRPRTDVDNPDALEPHRQTLQGDDYDALLAEAKASLPEGWVLLDIRVDR